MRPEHHRRPYLGPEQKIEQGEHWPGAKTARRAHGHHPRTLPAGSLCRGTLALSQFGGPGASCVRNATHGDALHAARQGQRPKPRPQGQQQGGPPRQHQPDQHAVAPTNTVRQRPQKWCGENENAGIAGKSRRQPPGATPVGIFDVERQRQRGGEPRRKNGEAHQPHYLQAVTIISTRWRGLAILASTQARAGWAPAGSHFTHSAFIASRSRISFSQI